MEKVEVGHPKPVGHRASTISGLSFKWQSLKLAKKFLRVGYALIMVGPTLVITRHTGIPETTILILTFKEASQLIAFLLALMYLLFTIDEDWDLQPWQPIWLLLSLGSLVGVGFAYYNANQSVALSLAGFRFILYCIFQPVERVAATLLCCFASAIYFFKV
jgi:hypothetical protein